MLGSSFSVLRSFAITLPLLVLACGSSTTLGDGDAGDGDGDAAKCSSEGAKRPADDGCNSCSCSGGQWSCTERDCSPGACENGESRSDGCNSCLCAEGQWTCTTEYCPPEPPPCDEGDTVVAEDCSACTCTDGEWRCVSQECGPEPECAEGDTRPALDGCDSQCTCWAGRWNCESLECGRECIKGETSDDGCNSCTCSGGQWACTAMVCPPDELECESGATKEAEDGCNTCTCREGTWACTEQVCQSARCGGLLGASCAPGEYCHYGAMDMCGATDAQGQCRLVPELCDALLAPVCGCDGKDYSNACVANRNETSVASEGRCQTE
jgi:hypothetical protein